MRQLLQLAYPLESEEEVEGQSQAHHSQHRDCSGGSIDLGEETHDKTGQGTKTVVKVVDTLDTTP